MNLLNPAIEHTDNGYNSLNQNTSTYNFGYSQGFLTGTALTVRFNNRGATNEQCSEQL